MRTPFFLLILFITTASFGQEYLLLKDGSTIECVKSSFLEEDGIVRLTLEGNKKKEISLENVDGLIDGTNKKIRYWRPSPGTFSSRHLVERLEYGHLILYEWIVSTITSGSYGGG